MIQLGITFKIAISLMPIGVEHDEAIGVHERWANVKIPQMPKGVEHYDQPTWKRDLQE